MCRVLQVSRAGFYAAERRVPSARACENEVLRALITNLYQRSRQTYGSPRIHQDVRAGGWRCGRQRIVRLMQQAGLRARTRRRWRPQTTNSKHGQAVPGNLLQRRFSVAAIGDSNRVWCGDVTYVRTGEGWLYLAVLIDLGNRMVVGWAMGERWTQNFASRLCGWPCNAAPPNQDCCTIPIGACNMPPMITANC